MIHGVQMLCSGDEGRLLSNMAHAMSLGLPSITGRATKKDGAVAIVGAGPSVRFDLNELLSWDGPVWAINGALDWLTENGRTPDACVLIDYQPHMVRYLTNPPNKTRYYVASVCDRAVFDALKDRDVTIFHMAQQGAMPPSGTYTVGCGPTALTRAPHLAYVLGYREVHVFGADSSFEDADGVPVSSVYDDGYVSIKFGEKFYRSHTSLLGQVSYLATLADTFDGVFRVRGSGLGPDFANAATAARKCQCPLGTCVGDRHNTTLMKCQEL